MADTLPNVVIAEKTIVDLYSETGIDVGTALTIQMIGSGIAKLYIGESLTEKPTSEDGFSMIYQQETAVTVTGDSGAFIWSEHGCELNVSETFINSVGNKGVPTNVIRAARIEGHATSLGGANVWHDIWEGDADIIPEPSPNGEQVQIVSSSNDDAEGGTGSNLVRLEYVNVAGELVSEDIVPTGTTPALSIATDVAHIIDMYNSAVGSGGLSYGDIELTKLGDTSTVYNVIKSGGNKSLCSLRHIPSGDGLYITGMLVSGDTKGTEVMLRSNSSDSGEVFGDTSWLFQVPITLSDAPAPVMFDPAIFIPQGAKVKVSAKGAASGSTVSVFINGWLA